MARPQITGLEYTRLDTDFMSDRKIKRLRRLTDPTAPLVYIQVVCAVLKEGYYIMWDKDFYFDIADTLDMDEDYVSSVIEACFDVGLLSREMFDRHHVVTSRGIQKQYEASKVKSKSPCRVKEYSLLDSDITPDYSRVITENPEETTDYSRVITENPGETANNSEQNILIENKENYSSPLPPSPEGDGGEEEKIVSYFFFEKNFKNPNEEYRKLVAYNNGPKARKKWAKMSELERDSARTLWRQNPEQKPRFREEFLKVWRKLYDIAKGRDAPREIRMAILGDDVSYYPFEGTFFLEVSQPLVGFIEEHIEEVRPSLYRFMKQLGCRTLTYKNPI